MAINIKNARVERLLDEVAELTGETKTEGIVLSARLRSDARGLLARLLQESGIAVLHVTEAHFGVAVDAWLRFGKGRHPASLNFGDCLSYATAVLAGAPLLCVGDDFAQTDVELG